MEFRKSNEGTISKMQDESTYSHFFEMNKTRNEESLLETTKNDTLINTEITQVQGNDNQEVSKVIAIVEEKREKTMINTKDSPTSNRANSIDVEEILSPGRTTERTGSNNFSLPEKLALNRTTVNSKCESIAGSIPQ